MLRNIILNYSSVIEVDCFAVHKVEFLVVQFNIVLNITFICLR
jgi:hypothetical protein